MRPVRFSRQVLFLLLVLFVGGCAASPSAQPTPPSSTDVWFLEMARAGGVWLAPERLNALGISSSSESTPTLRLTLNDRPLPHLPIQTAEGWGVLFFAPDGATRHTRRTVVRLDLGVAGTRLSPSAAHTSDAPAPARFTASWERDTRYLPQATAAVPWFWEPIYTPNALQRTVVLTDAQPGLITATVRLWSHTRFQPQPDHRAVLTWDGAVVGDWTWSGQGMQTLTGAWHVDEVGGEHTLTLETPAVIEDKVAVVWVDGWKMTYPRQVTTGRYTAQGDALRVPPGSYVLDVTDPFAPVNLGPAPDDGVVPSVEGRRYWVGTPEQAAVPLATRAAVPLETQTLTGTDYLIVAPTAFHAAVQPLVEHRQADGLRTAVVTPQAIYDTLGGGLPDPQAVRALLQILPDLRYLLLVGDATTEPWGYDGEAGALRIVTPFTRTAVLGETPADALLGSDAAGRPRVAVGRFPAASTAEVEALVEKTLAWEANLAAASPILLNDDEQEFVSALDALAELLPAEDAVPRLDAGDADCRDNLLAELGEGPRMLTYSGHGSLRQLGDEGVLLLEDGASWHEPSVVVAWTCLAAHFTHTQQRSMAEVWLTQPKGGAAAFLGPVGETTTAEQRPFAEAFYQALEEHPRLGDAWLHAQQQEFGASDVRWGFVILGDPALYVR